MNEKVNWRRLLRRERPANGECWYHASVIAHKLLARVDSTSISWQTNKTTEDKEEGNLPFFLKIEEKLLAGLAVQAQYERGNTKDARSPRNRGDGFF